MKNQNKLVYMVLGGFLALALVFGAYATFAQTDEDDADPAVPETESDESGDEVAPAPFGRGWPGRGGSQEDGLVIPDWHGQRPHSPMPDNMSDDKELLADALGISVEHLEAAYTDARTLAIEDAVANGLLTEEQADQLLTGEAAFPGRFGRGFMMSGHDTFLAEALEISVEDLQAARAEVQAARLAELVEEGVMTQEQADMITARRAVQSYIDREALAETVQGVYEDAVAQALADGVINQAQADQLLEALENAPGFGGFGGGFPGGRGFGGGRGSHGGHGRMAPFWGNPPTSDQTETEPASNA